MNLLHIRIPPKLQHNADSFLAGLVGNIHHIRQLPALHQICHIHQELVDPGPNHGIRNLTDNQLILIGAPPSQLYLHLSPQLDLPYTGLIDLCKAALIGNDPSCRKVWSRKICHHLLGGHIRLFDICLHKINDLPQIVRRDTGTHAHGNPFRTIDQKIRHPNRQHLRLLFRFIIIGHKIHGLIQIL